MKHLYRLKYANEQQWLSIKALLFDEEGEKLFDFHDFVYPVPMVQPLWNNTLDEDGLPIEEKPDKIPVEGFHVDICTKSLNDELTAILNDYIVTTSNPANTWSGGCAIVKPTPNIDWLKANIQSWLTDNSIEWTTSMTKDELLELI